MRRVTPALHNYHNLLRNRRVRSQSMVFIPHRM